MDAAEAAKDHAELDGCEHDAESDECLCRPASAHLAP
jgi:hypothetical protein